jgi:glycosyltransferase involved in cell wall biosynthesis
VHRILITNFHPRGGGGHVTYIRSLLALQDATDLRFAVATPRTSQLYEALRDQRCRDLYACDFPAKPHKELPSIVRSIGRFRRIVAEFKPDIVHANGGADLAIAVWSHRQAEYRIVRTHHAIRTLSNDFYHRYIYNRRVAQNIYVSASSMKISQARGLAPRHATVIANGVDLEEFRPDVPRDHDLAARLGLPQNAFVFGSCAGLDAYKRVDLAIAAAARLQSERPFVVLAIGEEDDGRRLEEKARRAGVAAFKYCGFYPDVRGFISLLDAGFVLSDRIETISYAAREMLAMGKPILSSSFAGLRENVIDGYNGFLVRPGDVDEVAAAMRRLLQMAPAELARLSANARSYAERNFSIDEQLRRHATLYEAVLTAR